MGNIVKILEPRRITDQVIYKSVTVEYDGDVYDIFSKDSNNGTEYAVTINGEYYEQVYDIDDDELKEKIINLIDKVENAYNEGILEDYDDSVSEIDLDEMNFLI